MRQIWVAVCAALLASPAPAAQGSPPRPDVQVTSRPAEAGADAQPTGFVWAGTFYRCSDVAAARRALAAVQGARPRTAEAAYPLLERAMRRAGCRETRAEFEWVAMPIQLEFDEDGQGLQLIEARDEKGRPLALVYRRGAC